MPEDAFRTLRRGKDWQISAPALASAMLPRAVSVPFGRESDGSMLSDHMGYVVHYRWEPRGGSTLMNDLTGRPTGRRWRTQPRARAGGIADRPLAIGIVLHDFALGGTERIALRLAQAWCDRGARVTIFCGSASGTLASLLDPRIDVRPAPIPIARARGSRRLLARAAAAFFTANPVDAVFIPGNFHWSVVPALAKIDRAIRPAIIAQVSAALDKPQRGPLRQAMFDLRMRRLLGQSDAIVALSEVARYQAYQITRGKHATTIALPALADDIAAPLPLPQKSVILGAGRLVPEKGFAELIDAFALMRDESAQLVIVGDGPEMESLKARAARHGVARRVSFPGYVPDIRPWLDSARIFALSSHFEGYPAVMIEALAAGRPVVATRCTPAIGDLLTHPGFGRSVPIRDVPALAIAMADQLAGPASDPGTLAGAVDHHRIGPVADAYLALFSDLVGQKADA